jgi:hypothetical protein
MHTYTYTYSYVLMGKQRFGPREWVLSHVHWGPRGTPSWRVLGHHSIEEALFLLFFQTCNSITVLANAELGESGEEGRGHRGSDVVAKSLIRLFRLLA